ncbi:MAG: zinc-binding dehydrogenase, partial [Pseudomonadota bacterium]
AGPIVEMDLRTFYLRDLSFFGSTIIDPEVTRNLVGYIENGEVKPALAAVYPLKDLRKAQADFIAKTHTGNIVVSP